MVGGIIWILVSYPEMGPFGPDRARNGPNSISPEPLVVQSWLTPHFNQNMHVSISVSYIVCPSDNRKCPKMLIRAN